MAEVENIQQVDLQGLELVDITTIQKTLNLTDEDTIIVNTANGTVQVPIYQLKELLIDYEQIPMTSTYDLRTLSNEVEALDTVEVSAGTVTTITIDELPETDDDPSSGYLALQLNGKTYKLKASLLGGSGSGGVLTEDIKLTGTTLGALPDNYTLKKGTTFTEFVKAAGQKETKPVGNKPSVSLALSQSGVLEAGKEYTIKITPTIRQNDGGPITSYKVYKNNTEIYSGTEGAVITDTLTLIHGSNVVYKATITYGDGPIPNTNLGNPYPAGQVKAGSVSGSAPTIIPVAPSYYGVINNPPTNMSELTSLTKRVSNSKNLTYDNITLNNQHTVYAYPSSLGTITSIKDGNNFEYINSYTKASAIINNVSYVVMYLKDKVTASGFKQVFS